MGKAGGNTIDWSEEGNNRRLLAAVYGASDNGKPNMKRVAKLFGKGATESAIENQMRKVKALAKELKDQAGDDEEVPVHKSPKVKDETEDDKEVFATKTPKKRKAEDNDEPRAKKGKKSTPKPIMDSTEEFKEESDEY